MENKSILIQNA